MYRCLIETNILYQAFDRILINFAPHRERCVVESLEITKDPRSERGASRNFAS